MEVNAQLCPRSLRQAQPGDSLKVSCILQLYYIVQPKPRPNSATNSYFFTVGVTEKYNRLPRETVDSPFVEIIKTHLDTYLGNLL